MVYSMRRVRFRMGYEILSRLWNPNIITLRSEWNEGLRRDVFIIYTRSTRGLATLTLISLLARE